MDLVSLKKVHFPSWKSFSILILKNNFYEIEKDCFIECTLVIVDEFWRGI